MNNLDEDIKIVEDARKFLAKIGLIKERDAISNVLTQLNTNKYDINNYEERITSLKSELETYKKIAEKLASITYDYANLGIVINCPAEYEGKVDLRKCKQNHIERNCVKCIIDWARKEVEND